ncbi:hypothetical protein [Streptomyces sp. NPDC001530]|uniref:hypothetical protein n=1 Tax=Streptomyces sp. NPDC001530 TaxID=3364582 RepID=UPI0036B4008A
MAILIDWADLVRAADPALPVVLLEGFDELLQATGCTSGRRSLDSAIKDSTHRVGRLTGQPFLSGTLTTKDEDIGLVTS